jgi:hypothetical protein
MYMLASVCSVRSTDVAYVTAQNSIAWSTLTLWSNAGTSIAEVTEGATRQALTSSISSMCKYQHGANNCITLLCQKYFEPLHQQLH